MTLKEFQGSRKLCFFVFGSIRIRKPSWAQFTLNYAPILSQLLLATFHNDYAWHCMWPIYCRYFPMNFRRTRERFFRQEKTHCFAYFNALVSEWNCYYWKPWNSIIVCAGFAIVSQCCDLWGSKHNILFERTLYKWLNTNQHFILPAIS